MSTLAADLRFAIRNLLKSPGFAVVTIVTLALGIGANAAMFSVVNGVVLQPLGYPQPERLVRVISQFPTMGFDTFWVSPPEFFELRERSRSFQSIGAYAIGAANLSGQDRPHRVVSVSASPDLFTTLGVPPLLGRTFTAEEDLPNAAPTVVLSYAAWQTIFGGDPGIVGRMVDKDGAKTMVVGVMPRGFDVFDAGAETFEPIGVDPADRTNRRGNHFLHLIGRLGDSATVSSARAELDTLVQTWREAVPKGHVPSVPNHKLLLNPLKDDLVGGARVALLVLQGAVGFVLLIACANLANLLLARAESRHREFAIRTALGAGRGRLLRQFLTEAVLFSILGAIVGLALAAAGVRALLAAYPGSIPRAAEIGTDPQVLLFTLVVALLTGCLFGLAPMLHLDPASVAAAIKEGGQRATSGARNNTRRALVVAEVALAVMLVIGAGLMLRSFWNLMQVDPGFRRDQLVTFGITLPAPAYPSNSTARVTFFQRLTEQLRQVPGVQGVAALAGLPPKRQVNANDTDIEGYTAPKEGPFENVDYYQAVFTGSLEALGIPIVEGRTFVPADEGGAPVVLINQTMAKTFWKGQSPIGRRVDPSGGNSGWFTIVGVVRDVKQGGLDAKTGTELFFNAAQLLRAAGFAYGQMNIVMRTSLPLATIASQVQQTVASMDPMLPVIKLQTMDDVFSESTARPRFLTQLLGGFALLALLLAAVGTYGILSYLVTERRREIGIRMALGANRSTVLSMVMQQGMLLAIAGLVIGVGGALGTTRVIASLLFGIEPTDPSTIAAVAAAIGTVALVACYVPARRATRVDPMVVLREE
ncbi:MAG: ABC transporter permease [Vicinamibacterales bacterium]